MNKKANTLATAIKWIPTIIFTLIVAVALTTLIDFYLQAPDTHFIPEAQLFTEQLTHNPLTITYADEDTGQAYPGIIDWNKYTDNTIEQQLMSVLSYGNPNNYLAAKITINEQTIYYNKEKYFVWEPRIGLKGEGAIRNTTITRPILIQKNNERTLTHITVHILKPVSTA